MATSPRELEEAVLRKIIPWLSGQLGQPLEWLGRPEDPAYCSRCVSAMSVPCRLDAELGGTCQNVAVEHTTVEAIPGQRGISAALRELRYLARDLRNLVPIGNSVTLGVPIDCVRHNLTSRVVKKQVPIIEEKLKKYLATVPQDPARGTWIRRHLLEEPLHWQFGRLKITVNRRLRPGKGNLTCPLLASPADWETGLRNCLKKAINTKVPGKSASYAAYRSEGWLVVVVVELADYQLSSMGDVTHAFRVWAPDFDFGCVDGIVLMDQIDTDIETPVCCWAYLRGEVRSREQQYAERCQCLGIVPND